MSPRLPKLNLNVSLPTRTDFSASAKLLRARSFLNKPMTSYQFIELRPRVFRRRRSRSRRRLSASKQRRCSLKRIWQSAKRTMRSRKVANI